MDTNFFKVISYNIYKGFTNEAEEDLPSGDERKQLISEWLQEVKPDVVAFQELNGYTYQKLEQESRAWKHPHTSVLYGKSDFRVGISSRHPIEVQAQIFQDMWHGLLHVSTGGVEVIVTHFSPFEYQKRHQEVDIALQQLQEARQRGKELLLMGDLNSLSPDDAEAIEKTDIIETYARHEQEKEHIQNLKDGQPDYETIRKLKEADLTDVQVQQRVQTPTLPMPRLDYIWATEGLAKHCTEAEWHTGERFAVMSDHYPVSATFQAVFSS
ncbi:MAG: endonuclease/exonuclease/phosphatase family protein [Cyclobacteriaceae bacterium]